MSLQYNSNIQFTRVTSAERNFKRRKPLEVQLNKLNRGRVLFFLLDFALALQYISVLSDKVPNYFKNRYKYVFSKQGKNGQHRVL